jgi:MYXO-CTERM domain-containing protein
MGPAAVFLRLPSGERRKVSPFAGATTLEGLNGAGDVMMASGGRRYLARSGEFPVDVSGPLGQVRAFDNAWYLLVDQTVFRYDFNGAGDGGAATGADAAADASGNADADASAVADASGIDAETGEMSDGGDAAMASGAEASATVDALGGDAGIGAISDTDAPNVVSSDATHADAVGPYADASAVHEGGVGGEQNDGGSAPSPGGSSSDDGGCSTVPRSSSPPFGWVMLVGIGLGAARKRRRDRIALASKSPKGQEPHVNHLIEVRRDPRARGGRDLRRRPCATQEVDQPAPRDLVRYGDIRSVSAGMKTIRLK